MLPCALPESVVADPRRSAERVMYEAFERLLPDSMTVFYGVTWLAKRRGGDARDGEADFLVLDRARGLLVVEVKGGKVSRDAASGRWSSTDRKGTVHSIDDPAQQAKRNKFALMEKIRSLPGWGSHWIPIGHSVAFPDCVLDAGTLPHDLPESITVFSDSLKWLPEKIASVVRLLGGGRSGKAGHRRSPNATVREDLRSAGRHPYPTGPGAARGRTRDRRAHRAAANHSGRTQEAAPRRDQRRRWEREDLSRVGEGEVAGK